MSISKGVSFWNSSAIINLLRLLLLKIGSGLLCAALVVNHLLCQFQPIWSVLTPSDLHSFTPVLLKAWWSTHPSHNYRIMDFTVTGLFHGISLCIVLKAVASVMRILSIHLFVCLSDRLSNAWIVTKRKKDLSRFLYHTKDHLVFLRRRTVGGRQALLPEMLLSTGPHWSEIADFEPIFARSASAVTPSENISININRKYNTSCQMSLKWSSYVASKPPKPKGGSKCKTDDFRVKS